MSLSYSTIIWASIVTVCLALKIVKEKKKEKDNRIVTISTWPTGGLTGCTVEGVARQVVRYLGVEGDKEELGKEKKNEKL